MELLYYVAYLFYVSPDLCLGLWECVITTQTYGGKAFSAPDHHSHRDPPFWIVVSSGVVLQTVWPSSPFAVGYMVGTSIVYRSKSTYPSFVVSVSGISIELLCFKSLIGYCKSSRP